MKLVFYIPESQSNYKNDNFWTLNMAKSISRKIWVAEKFFDFPHCVLIRFRRSGCSTRKRVAFVGLVHTCLTMCTDRVLSTVWKKQKFTLTEKKIRQINLRYSSLVATSISRNFVAKLAKLWEWNSIISTLWYHSHVRTTWILYSEQYLMYKYCTTLRIVPRKFCNYSQCGNSW